MSSKVFFLDMRANSRRTVMQKYQDMIKQLDPAGRIKPGGSVAIKVHFGEKGNFSYVRPQFVRPVVDAVKAAGGQPFITDCNTLYVGTRSDSVNHLTTALQNGFAYAVVDAPLIIGDGLYGGCHKEVAMNLPDCKTAYIGADIAAAQNLITISHFKGHELTGFGGVLKNLGMGCASRAGKLFQHSNVSPTVKDSACVGCGICVKRCPAEAITLIDRPEGKGKLALKDDKKCIGCGDCILACNYGAMTLNYDAQVPELMRRMVAHAKACFAGKDNSGLHISFITQVSPACDCYPFNDAPIVPDLGIMGSTDPVALDAAAVDMVNNASGLMASRLKHSHAPGEDKFKALYPKSDWEIQLNYGQEIGLGSRGYELVTIS